MLAVAAWFAMGCSGPPAPTVAEPELEVPAALIDATWVAAAASEEALVPFSEPGWVALLMKRDYAEATRALGPGGGLAAARAHAEAAALYRQAALITAYGVIEVYGKTPEPSDPVGVAHLLTVSYTITGDLDRARAAAAELDGVTDDPTLAWHQPWKTWLAAGASPAWPPDLSSLPLTPALPPPTPGAWPEVTGLPHYSLPELAGSSATRDMGDPGALVALASWHDAVVTSLVPDPAALATVRTLRAGYRLPIEAAPPAGGPLPPELLFGSDLLVGADAPFLADLEGPAGLDAIDEHAETSLLAWVAAHARVDGKLDPERVTDHLGAVRKRLIARAAEIAGSELGHHRTFADVAYVGALRSLALVAERAGDRETSGLLRIGALERSDKATACPVGLLALAAWDASNRYPMRAQDIVHAQARRYPSLEVARYGLDVLGLRVGAERVGETAGM